MIPAAARGYAGIVSRAAAFVVDAVAVTIVATGFVLLVELLGFVLGGQARDLARPIVSAFLVAVPTFLILYSTVFWALAGRTPGMALLGVRVVPVRGDRVSWPSALVRAVVRTVFPIGVLWCTVDRRRQAVHDKLARTAVVYSGSPAPPGVGVSTHSAGFGR